MATKDIMAAANAELKNQVQLEAITKLRQALKLIQEDASRPADETRAAMIHRIAEKALADTQVFEGRTK